MRCYIMKRVPIVFSTIFLISIMSLMSISTSMPLAEASHTSVTATVDILKNGVVAFTYSEIIFTEFGANINVDMNKRDEGRFDRYCGGFHTFEIESSEAASFTCIGKGPWDVRISLTSITHPFQISILVNAM